jgi:c(7)-type cytochrome triheme protein
VRPVKYLWLLLPPLLVSVSCSQGALSVFFDVPPPSEEKKLAAAEKRRAPKPTVAAETPVTPAGKEAEQPKIETTLGWEEFAKQLPKDRTTGQSDWMVALRQGVIKPRTANTEWLACDSCHPKIFRTRGTKITMADLQGGKYCGVCHGRVAFGLDQCARCHVAMAQ